MTDREAIWQHTDYILNLQFPEKKRENKFSFFVTSYFDNNSQNDF